MAIIKKPQVKKDSFFDPRCCTYKLSGKMRNHIEKLIDNESETSVKDILREIMDEDEANKNTLTYDSLVKLHKYMQRSDKDYLEPFYVFVEHCKCLRPKPRDNKQLNERLQLLRLKNSHALYDNMTASVDRNVEKKLEKQADREDQDGNSTSKLYENDTSVASEFKKLNGSIVAVFNSFLVFICTFIFCYKALEYALPQPNIIAQTLFGILGSTIVAIAELYFLIRIV